MAVTIPFRCLVTIIVPERLAKNEKNRKKLCLKNKCDKLKKKGFKHNLGIEKSEIKYVNSQGDPI